MSNRSNISLIGNSTTAQNIGGGAGIFAGKNNGNNLQFKSICATGTSIQIFNCSNQIYISGATGGGGGTVTSAGNGLTLSGSKIILGGALTGNTAICLNNNSFRIGCSAESTSLYLNGVSGSECVHINVNNDSYLNICGASGLKCAYLQANTNSYLDIKGNLETVCLSASPSSYIFLNGVSGDEKLCVRGKLYVSGLTNSTTPDAVYYDSATKEFTYGTASGGTGTTYVCVDSCDNIYACNSLLPNLTTGNSNIIFGRDSLYSNTTGVENISLGREALYSNTTGTRNISIGSATSYYNTTGNDNIAIGTGVLSNNLSGDTNIAIGYQTMVSNTTGLQNIAIGQHALCFNITGSTNIAIGTNAGYSATGSTNIYMGNRAAYTNTGNFNVIIGNDSGFYSTTGSSSIIIGNYAGYFSSGSCNTFIGQCAGYNAIGSNKLYIANNANKSLIYGEFDNEKLCIRGKTYISGLTNSCNSNLIYYNDSTNELTYGVSCYLPLTGGTVSGCITAVNFILSSDERLKENISSISHSEIDKVNLVQFNFKCDETKHLRYGVVAQDLEKVHPEMVFENYDGYKEVAYIDFLVAKINSLENRLITLESKIL